MGLINVLDFFDIYCGWDDNFSNLNICWKSLQAIESFAVTVKEIAQLLQSFGTELAEIDLPDEANAIEYLLTAHTDKYRQMKVGVTLLKIGKLHFFSLLHLMAYASTCNFTFFE